MLVVLIHLVPVASQGKSAVIVFSLYGFIIYACDFVTFEWLNISVLLLLFVWVFAVGYYLLSVF